MIKKNLFRDGKYYPIIANYVYESFSNNLEGTLPLKKKTKNTI